jgi:hypothetical protein
MFVLFQVTTETYGLKFSGYWQSMGRKCSLPSYKNETRLILANMKLANNNLKTRVRTRACDYRLVIDWPIAIDNN